MRIHVYGNKDKPELMLLPGNCLNGQDVYGEVIEMLRDTFHIICVCYNGFDGNEKTTFEDVETEVKTIEGYIKENYRGQLFAVYGSGFGGTVAAVLVQRGQLHFEHLIMGATDFDRPSYAVALLESFLFAPSFYDMIHTGLPMSAVAKDVEHLSPNDSYLRQLKLMGMGKGGLSYVNKKSVRRQFFSEWTVKLKKGSRPENTVVTYLLSELMGEKYVERCRAYFPEAVVATHPNNRKAEELLFTYPKMWAEKIREITGKPSEVV